eukprot:1360919-Amorphochlora_amoeboformis.AAC.1
MTLNATCGQCILFDYRIKHRGLGNRSDQERPVIYITYAHKSFKVRRRQELFSAEIQAASQAQKVRMHSKPFQLPHPGLGLYSIACSSVPLSQFLESG